MAVSAPFCLSSFWNHGMTFSNLRGAKRTIHMHGSINTKYAASSWGLKVNVPAKVTVTRVGAIDSSSVIDLDVGRMVDRFIFRRNFDVRTYETGPDRKVSIETLMNILQETAINHIKAIGLLGDGLGLSPEMCKKNLIWVMGKMLVEVDSYPMCGDIIQVDTWKAAYGKIGMYSNWKLCDAKTGEILIRASCVWLMMNTETRKLSKFPDEVRDEFDKYFVDTPPIVNYDNQKWSTRNENTVHHVCHGLAPTWSDLDINQHVNNARYIGWILKSVPRIILEKYEIVNMALEYCQECRNDNVLQSHTFVVGTNDDKLADNGHVELEHLLELEIGSSGGGGEIMKGRTTWQSKHGKGAHRHRHFQ
ncbi:palmitoyl-acyl carrier protein thioesterase, chloroplastic-like [Rutidosis leptorrhynchoides]|uniref:palmitoyl-acyl carrier protein thioesterase, chloroplastic-like n=1 Tax=Rutidosis leptorrhynchoides TaxID=125765 RepID=UPI003A9A4607